MKSNRPRSVGRIVTGSIILGILLVLLLDFVVFAGAIEPVITGATMCGFGAGWLALALVSSRYSDQPQQWAYVPAAYFGAVGLFVLMLRPSDVVLSRSGWIWPIVLFAVTVWSYVRAKKQLHSRTKHWVLYPVLTVILLTAMGGMYETIWEHATAHTYTMPGRLVDVGGYKLHIDCRGSGSPTVVFESGLGEPSPIMAAWMAPIVGRQARACVYDRQGRGWSEASPRPLDGDQTAAALHTLLSKAGISEPIVIAGHSAGGIYALNYAKQYPDQVAGVVLLDSMSPYQYESLPGWSMFYAGFRRVSALAPSLTRAGVGQVMYASAYPDLPSPQQEQERAFWASPRLWRNQRDEFAVLRTALLQAQAVRSIGAKPLYVVSGQKGEQGGWGALQDNLATLSRNSVHVTIQGATHADIPAKKAVAAQSARAVLQVVEAVRTDKKLEEE